MSPGESRPSPSGASPWRAAAIAALLPALLLLPYALWYGAISVGDHEMVGKLGLLKALREGTSLAWTEAIECGTLLFGSLSLPLTFGDSLFAVLDERWASNFSQILDLALAGFGFALWRMRSGAATGPSVLGAVVYACSLFPVSRVAQGHQCISSQFAWFPFLLWAVDGVALRRSRRALVALPLLVFLLAMGTYPSTTIVFALVAAARAAWAGWRAARGTPDGRPVWTGPMFPLLVLLAAGVLGVAMAGFVYVPSLAFARHAVMPGSAEFDFADYAYHLSLPAPLLPTMFIPYLYGGSFVEDRFWGNFLAPHHTGGFHEFVLYAGLVPLWLAWSRRRELAKEPEARFWFAIAVFLLLVSLGRWGGIYPLLARLPVLNSLRGPSRFLAALPMVLACLATLGAVSWRARPEPERSHDLALLLKWVLTVIVLSALALVGALGLSTVSTGRIAAFVREYILVASATNLQIACLFAMAWALAWLAVPAPRRLSCGFLVVLAFVDLAVHNAPRLAKPSGNYACYLTPQPVSEALRRLTACGKTRYAALNHCVPHNLALLDGTADILGFKDFSPRWHVELVRAINGDPPFTYSFYDWGVKRATSPLLSLCRVSTVVSLTPLAPPWKEVGRVGALRLFQGPSPFPPAWLAVNVSVEPDRKRRIERMVLEAEKRSLLLTSFVEEAAAVVETSPLASSGAVDLRHTGALRYEAMLRQPTRGVLCTSIGYSPEWKAFADGVEAPVVRVNHAFVGVKLAKPASRVEICFVPTSHLLGIKVSAVAFSLWLLLALAMFWQARRHATRTRP